MGILADTSEQSTLTMTKAEPAGPRLNRTTLRTSRLLDFCSRKELIAQTGSEPESWPLVVLKELLDNSLDACEEGGVSPEITVTVDDSGITVSDNGPGIPADTIEGVLDFSVRVSNREAYVSPTRGQQGNALKTIVALPYVLDGEEGHVEITARGERHRIGLKVDHIRQEPIVEHTRESARFVQNGTSVTVHWPDLACSILKSAGERFVQIADDYTWLNPHLTLAVDWFGATTRTLATAPDWAKWLPSDPTCSHWYDDEHFERLIAGYIAHDADHGRDRTVRELVSEFRGLTRSAKQKAVLDATGLARMNLSALADGNGIRTKVIRPLLAAMKAHTKPVKPATLGVIGEGHFRQRFEGIGCELASFQYHKEVGTTDELPWVMEMAFGWVPKDDAGCRLVTGANWSPGILNPFRQLGHYDGESCDTLLAKQRIYDDDPVILVMHVACPKPEYTDRGKSAIVMG